MLGKVRVRRELQPPPLAAQLDGGDAQAGLGRVLGRAGEFLVLQRSSATRANGPAAGCILACRSLHVRRRCASRRVRAHACGIVHALRRGRAFRGCRRDGARILLGFGQVDGAFQRAVGALARPTDGTRRVCLEVAAGRAQRVQVGDGRFPVARVQAGEGGAHFIGRRKRCAHQAIRSAYAPRPSTASAEGRRRVSPAAHPSTRRTRRCPPPARRPARCRRTRRRGCGTRRARPGGARTARVTIMAGCRAPAVAARRHVLQELRRRRAPIARTPRETLRCLRIPTPAACAATRRVSSK